MHLIQRKTWAVLNLVGFMITITVNGMANTLPINGKTTGEISDIYPNLFTPAGFTFSIWGLIYLALLGFSVFQLVMAWKKDQSKSEFIERIGPYFLLSSLANASWILAWHHQIIWLSLCIMLLIFGALYQIYRRMDIGSNAVTPPLRWCVHAPFSLYLGWITIATIANVTILLTDLGWNGFGIGPVFWALLVLWAGVTVAYRVLQHRHDLIFVCVVMWAYFGIIMKRLEVGADITDTVSLGALLGITLLAIAIVYHLFNAKKTAA